MILHPDEQNALDVIGSHLGAAEPHLAGMFMIFTRLTAADGIPPDEDRVTAFWPSSDLPRRRRSLPARLALGGPAGLAPGRPGRGFRPLGPLGGRLQGRMRFVLVPAALVIVLGLIIYATVTTSARCVAGRPARTAAATDYSPVGRVCAMPPAAAPPGTSSR